MTHDGERDDDAVPDAAIPDAAVPDGTAPDAAAARAAEVARLQRVAFGSGASDAERDAAFHELARSADDSGAVQRAAPEHEPDPSPPGGGTTSAAPDRPESRMRWALIAGAIALTAGVLIGWGLGTRAPGAPPAAAPPPTPTAVPYAYYLETLPLVSEAAASKVFTRESISGDALPRSWVRDGFRQQRLLLTLPDGSGVFAALRDEEACLVLDFADGGLTRCTEGGRFPEGGIQVVAEREAARFTVVWSSDGMVAVTADQG
ncbi:hypothetical protein [Agromyces aureus]|uniref:Uncharacterized protein n=1 Tax=Agromyces aureus TaxID=453304 RepID=A0A191WBE4_9MICO|nr:hypothetical protein [Agromyces aureus]ANJ25562.1 hypothetical protein ATC03_01005 [Agromyces aureus]